jgi:hypothetical protein
LGLIHVPSFWLPVLFIVLKLLRFLLISAAVFLCTNHGWAQKATAPATPDEPVKQQKSSSSLGDVMLKLGKGLLKEVSRRLNLEEAEIITVRKEAAADGSIKYHVDTGKFQFDIKRKAKSATGKQ